MAQFSSKALSVKYRPKTFEQLVGQQTIADILQEQIRTKTFRNVALFTGPPGCGKTTSARAFASLLNGGKGLPIEIDAASNNSVDNVRDIIVKAQQKSLDSEYKVFILDECHSLSNQAWQAFLKVIEEPPANTVFIFCTTEKQKIPQTIISRVQSFEFRRISLENIIKRLKYIIDCENAENGNKYTYTEEALEFIARRAEGGMRDAITTLDKCLAYSPALTVESAVTALGEVNYQIYFDLTNAIIDYKESVVIDIIENCYADGVDLKQFIKQYTLFLLDVCKYILFNNFTYIKIPSSYEENLKSLVDTKDFLKVLLDEINKLNSEIKWETAVKNIVELRLLVLTQPEVNQ